MINSFDPFRIEYEKLKDEQRFRIRFRDSMIPISLAATGAVISFSLSGDEENDPRIYALLIVPFVSFILGWLWVINDEKITQLGRYFRHWLRLAASKVTELDDELLFRWEQAHRTDDYRALRKGIDLTVQLVSFAFPGPIACLILQFTAGFPSIVLGSLAWSITALSTGLMFWVLLVFTDRSCKAFEPFLEEAARKHLDDFIPPKPPLST